MKKIIYKGKSSASSRALLELENIKKDYHLGNSKDVVHALKGINLSFRKNEFVSILGPSGCGKTTLLNIIGGLDKYSSGDLFIGGKSTKNFTDRDWDIYRNHHIGFIFQSYNLIPHQTILGNVELALTISGVTKKERIKRAKSALDKVGLKGMYKKHPNQLSGGQCQRVAIARALVNEPDILLADEPTGALDTTTSTQIMDLIKEISKERLVIMVTHNPDIANTYSTRIINLLDGLVVNDSNPIDYKKEKQNILFEQRNEQAKMNFVTAFRLSLRNLLSKFKRTLLVCIAGSIGVVGVSTVLAVSSGIHHYIDSMQDDLLSGNPITITETAFDINSFINSANTRQKVEIVVEDGKIGVNSIVKSMIERSESMNSYSISNEITEDYIEFVKQMNPEYYAAISLDYGIDVSNSIYTDWKYSGDGASETMSISAITKMYSSVIENTDFADYSSYISQLSSAFSQAPNNQDYILSQYDLLKGNIATKEDEIMVVVSKNRQLNDVLLAQLGYYTQKQFINIIYEAKNSDLYDENQSKYFFDYDEILNKAMTWYPNDTIFVKNNGLLAEANPYNYKAYKDDSFENGINLKIVGILQAKDDISYGCLSAGFYYTEALTKKIIEQNIDSEIVNYYKEKNVDTVNSGAYTIPLSGQVVPSGISYKYYFIDKDIRHEDITGYVGNESMLSSFFNMISSYFGGSSNQGTETSSTNTKFYSISLRQLGGNDIANSISIFPTNFASKSDVTAYLDKWNDENEVIEVNNKSLDFSKRSKVTYTDNLEVIIKMINTMIDIVTYALIVFTALSLLVSTVMIGVITYVSVVERVKEIGVIRSLGGRKKDVSHLFNAETFIIGLTSGMLGILITIVISIIINIVVGRLANIKTVALVEFGDATIMILVSIILTLISGLVPAKAAANKNPVDALRSE